MTMELKYKTRAELEQIITDQDYPTLRDQFAMAALTGLIAMCKTEGVEEVLAEDSYRLADAMLKERAKVRE